MSEGNYFKYVLLSIVLSGFTDVAITANVSASVGTTPAPSTGCITVFHNTSVIFSNPRAGKLTGLTLRFVSDVSFNRTSRIVLKLPGFNRLGGSSGAQFMFAAGTTAGALTGGSVAVGAAGDAGIPCFTGAQWDDDADLLTLTHLAGPPVPAGPPATESNCSTPARRRVPRALVRGIQGPALI